MGREEIELLDTIEKLLQRWKDSRYYIKEPDISHTIDSERKIFNYIQTHPNISKQELVDNFYGTFSRMTVYKILDHLAKYNMIKQNRNPENKQSYDIAVNNNNFLVQLITETDITTKVIVDLLGEITKTIDANKDKNRIKKVQKLLLDITKFSRTLFDFYLMQILFETEKESQNKDLITRACNILFKSIFVILNEVMAVYQKVGSPNYNTVSLLSALDSGLAEIKRQASELSLERTQSIERLRNIVDFFSQSLPPEYEKIQSILWKSAVKKRISEELEGIELDKSNP